MSHRASGHAAVVAVLLVVTVLVTWPTVATIGTAIPGQPTSDAYDHLWGAWWYAHEIGNGELPVRTEISHWPPGGLLWFIDPLGALLSLPFQLVLSPAGAYSCVAMLQVLGGMLGAYALAWTKTGARVPAALAGVIYGASPFVLSLLHSGTMEYLALAPLPLAWLAFERALASGSRRDVGLAAGAWASATLGNFYYAAFTGLLLLVAVWLARGLGWRVVLERAATVILVFAAVAAPILAVAGWTLTSPEAVVDAASAPGWNYEALPATDLTTFLRPGDHYFPDNRKTGNFGIIHVNYLGWVTFALALFGAWRQPRWRVPLAVAAVLALGPTLCVDGQLVFVAGRPLPLPASLLYLPGSPFRFVHHPFRLVVLLMLFAGQAAAAGLAARPRVAAVAGGLVLAETLLLSPAVFPLPTAPARAPAAIAALARDATVDTIWDFPPNHHVANRRYEMLQTVHGKRVPYGVNAFLPEAWRDNHFVRAMMQCLKKPVLTAIPREGGRPLDAWLQKPVKSRVAEGREELLEDGFDLVVLHLGSLAESERACARRQIGGAARHADDEVELWPLAGETVAAP